MATWTFTINPTSATACVGNNVTATLTITARNARGLPPAPTRFYVSTSDYGALSNGTLTTNTQGVATTLFYYGLNGNNYGPTKLYAHPESNSDDVKTVTFTCPPAPVIN